MFTRALDGMRARSHTDYSAETAKASREASTRGATIPGEFSLTDQVEDPHKWIEEYTKNGLELRAAAETERVVEKELGSCRWEAGLETRVADGGNDPVPSVASQVEHKLNEPFPERVKEKHDSSQEDYCCVEAQTNNTFERGPDKAASPDSTITNDHEQECETECNSANTSMNSSFEYVHKPLKDLIYKTNKNIYDVDSRKVKYKAGLSKRNNILPSLHRNRKLSQ